MISNYISVITPLLLHMLLSEAVVFLMGNKADVTTCTAITALIVIPVAGWMCYRDRQSQIIQQSQDIRSSQEVRDIRDARENRQNRRIPKGKKIAFGVFCFAAGAALNVLWSGILNMLRIGEHFSNQTQEALLASRLLVQLIGLGILVPVAEELIFRALIYRRMKALMPLWAAALLSSVLFAVYHGNMIQIIFALPMALVLALVYERGQGIIFPVLFHMGANLAAIILNFL